jgi:SsrA-binding protein
MAKKIEYKPVNIKNKKAFFDFEILDTYTAGMMLKGTEIKSIRLHQVSLGEAYCYFKENELYIKSMNISSYEMGTHFNHEPSRDRKLLLNKKELIKIQRKLEEKGLAIVPLRLFMSDRGFAKLEIGLAKGKKLHDKRDSLKEKDAQKRIKEDLK